MRSRIRSRSTCAMAARVYKGGRIRSLEFHSHAKTGDSSGKHLGDVVSGRCILDALTGQHGVGVEDVEHVEHRGPLGAADPNLLFDPQVELIEVLVSGIAERIDIGVYGSDAAAARRRLQRTVVRIPLPHVEEPGEANRLPRQYVQRRDLPDPPGVLVPGLRPVELVDVGRILIRDVGPGVAIHVALEVRAGAQQPSAGHALTGGELEALVMARALGIDPKSRAWLLEWQLVVRHGVGRLVAGAVPA